MKGENKGQSKRQNMLARRNRNRLIAALGAMVVVATALALMVPALSMTRGMLVCGLEEHEHADACYEQVLVCGLEEGEDHEHSADCYETQLVCDLPEHVHLSACYDAPDISDSADEADGDAAAGESDAAEADGSADGNGSQADSGNAASSASSASSAANSSETSSAASAGSAGETAAIKTESDGEADDSADAMPAQKFEADLKDADDNTVLTVRVDAPKDAFPAETFMKIDGVLAKDVQARVKEAVLKAIGLDEESGDATDDALSNGVLIERMDAVDITFFDKDGNQVQPSKKVTVEITADQVHDANNLALVHVLEVDGIVKNADGSIVKSNGKPFKDMADAYKDAELVEEVRLAKQSEDADAQDAGAQEALTFKSQEFSPYVLVNLSDEAAAALKEAMPKAVVNASAAGEAAQDGDESADANVVESESRPAQSFRRDIIDESGATVLKVTVEAPEGSLTADSSMVAELVEDEDVLEAAKGEAINSGIGQNADATEANTNAVAADITFLDAEGNKQEPAGDVRVTMTSPVVAAEGDVAVVHVEDDLSTQLVDSPDIDAAQEAVAFDASSFSVYAIVYTVDFHWEVDGKTFTFSIPGGGFVSLYNLVETLGIAADDASTEKDEIQELVDGVESVEFSDPELVSVSKVEQDATVGAIKDRLGLDCVYSAELTEQQIAQIDAQEAKAGDWALIALKPFVTEESLTVTMKNGDKWTVKVTDAQKAYKDVSSLENGNYIIYRSDNSSTRFMYLKNDGTTKTVFPGNGDALNANDLSDYTWSVTKNPDGTFTIKSTNGNRYINLHGNSNERDKWSNNSYASVSLSGNNGIAISHNGKVLKRNDNGFYNSTGTGVGLTFYKIEDNPSGGSSGTSGIELTDEERAEMEKWKETLAKFNTLTDYNKTAEVFSEDNRIYQINIAADSGITDFYKNVDLGLVLDVSNSMKFPSSLKALEDSNGNDLQVWMDADWLNWAKNAYSNYYNQDGCFYIISDPALTSTIYKIWKDGNQWKYQDASENPGVNTYNVNSGTVFKEPYRQAYTLYYADDKKKRMTYLQDSVTFAIDTLKTIVRPTEHVDDDTATVQVAYNYFAGLSSNNQPSGQTQYAIRGSHDFVNLRAESSSSFTVSPAGNEASGTRQDLALFDTNDDPNLAANEFGWHSGYDKYVILVTDGAPNGASMADVIQAANELKNEDKVKIISIGLSTKDVDGGSQMLKTIADDVDGDGVPEFYEAEKAKDLEYIFLRILRSIMAKGLVKGKVADTIDEGFYPVDAEGNPLSAGVYQNGMRIPNAQISNWVSNGKPTNAHANEAFYTWEQVGDKWKITWYNQEIGWDDNNSSTGNPWTGTVYVKAKEDYLGGNLIETNDGNAQIEPTGLKLVINGTPETSWRPLEGMTPIDLPVPRVNVHNLETKENSTTWTVYRGASITPGDQIKALWNSIPIEEVVSASQNGEHKITTGSSANVGAAGTGETFTLGSLMSEVAPSFNIESLINQITMNKSSASQEFPYTAYGHESGRITVKVERTIGNQTPATHTADTVGTPIEQYKVTFTYKPYAEAERKAKLIAGNELDDAGKNDNDYHNGSAGRGNEETGTITSANTHTINAFQKGIKVTKIDKTNPSTVLPGAVFELYRVDAAGNADVSAYDLPFGNYSKVGGDLTADASGVIAINPVIPDKDSAVTGKTLYEPNINVGATADTSHDTVFYLVEKTAPTVGGTTYSKMPGAIKFTVTLTEDKGADSAATLYDWEQSVTIAASEYQNGSTEYLISEGTDGDVYLYKIKNGKPTDITLIKVDKTTQNSIDGAKFSLLKGSANVDLAKLKITAINGGAAVVPEDYDLNGTTIKVVTVPKGGIRIAGLADDTYTLREIAAPAGYIITDSGRTFKTENGAIKETDDTDHTNEATNIAFKVENEAGAPLPNTGGPGTNLTYLFGTALTVFAGAGLTLGRRKRDVAA